MLVTWPKGHMTLWAGAQGLPNPSGLMFNGIFLVGISQLCRVKFLKNHECKSIIWNLEHMPWYGHSRNDNVPVGNKTHVQIAPCKKIYIIEYYFL